MTSDQMFADNHSSAVFATSISQFTLDPETAETINRRLKRRVNELVPDLPGGRAAQSQVNLQESAHLADLNKIVLSACEKICNDLTIVFDRLLITGCWVNVADKMIQHQEHNHPNNYLSAVYYVETPKGGDTITFLDPRPQAGVLVPKVRELSPGTATFVSLGVSSGALVVFPSWLRHKVQGTMGEGRRISVAYNLQFDNMAETLGEPLFKGNFQLT